MGKTDKKLFISNSDSRDKININNFLPTFFDKLDVPKNVSEFCKGERFCIFDYIVSGYSQMGTDTSFYIKKSLDIKKESSKNNTKRYKKIILT